MDSEEDSWTLLNRFASEGFASLIQLGEINLHTMEKLAICQMDAMNLCMESGIRQFELSTQVKGLNDL